MSRISRQIIKRMRELGDADHAVNLQRFFKTGPGEYGEGDVFLGIRMPVVRKCVKEFRDTPLDDTLEVLKSPLHEVRMLALLILVDQYKRSTANSERRTLYRTYLSNTQFINNWDLIDATAHHIVGAYLYERDRKPLYRLAKSKSLWERRISIISTFNFIAWNDFIDSLAIAELLLNDTEDLIHKAVGWALREIGNKDLAAEERFLRKHYRNMPRTMLRYAIEKFPEPKRKAYLHGKI